MKIHQYVRVYLYVYTYIYIYTYVNHQQLGGTHRDPVMQWHPTIIFQNWSSKSVCKTIFIYIHMCKSKMISWVFATEEKKTEKKMNRRRSLIKTYCWDKIPPICKTYSRYVHIKEKNIHIRTSTIARRHTSWPVTAMKTHQYIRVYLYMYTYIYKYTYVNHQQLGGTLHDPLLVVQWSFIIAMILYDVVVQWSFIIAMTYSGLSS